MSWLCSKVSFTNLGETQLQIGSLIMKKLKKIPSQLQIAPLLKHQIVFCNSLWKVLPSLKLTWPWKLMVGRWISFWDGLFQVLCLFEGVYSFQEGVSYRFWEIQYWNWSTISQIHPLNPSEKYHQIGHLSPKIKTLKKQITINKSENPYQPKNNPRYPRFSIWRFQPNWKILVKLYHFPKSRGEKNTCETTNQFSPQKKITQTSWRVLGTSQIQLISKTGLLCF